MNTKPVIMVVEDEQLLLSAITKKLLLMGVDFVACTSGKQALDQLTSLSKPPDAIWLDYYLKDMNGIEFMEVLKKNTLWSTIPVFVVSNSANEQNVHSMLALGAARYFVKADHRLDELIGEILALTGEKL